jgi:hypothetical protein
MVQLLIHSIETELMKFPAKEYVGRVRLELKYYCNSTGKHYKTVRFIAVAHDPDITEVLRKAIESFLNGDVEKRSIDFYTEDVVSLGDTNKIDHIQYSHLPEPFYSMFRDLFRAENWNIEKLALA